MYEPDDEPLYSPTSGAAGKRASHPHVPPKRPVGDSDSFRRTTLAVRASSRRGLVKKDLTGRQRAVDSRAATEQSRAAFAFPARLPHCERSFTLTGS